MSVEFTDNSMKVKQALRSGVSAFLREAGGELQAQIIRNSRTDTGQTKGSYQYKVQEESDGGTVYVGSDMQNAIWEEFGTGEYALHGDGRKGGWVYPNPKARYNKDGKLRKNSKPPFYFTLGKKPNRPMHKAFIICKERLKRRLSNIL